MAIIANLMCYNYCVCFFYTDVFVQIGDMTIVVAPKHNTTDERRKRLAISNLFGLWPGAVIPYLISDVFTRKYGILYDLLVPLKKCGLSLIQLSQLLCSRSDHMLISSFPCSGGAKSHSPVNEALGRVHLHSISAADQK